jgi:hypothetical protein
MGINLVIAVIDGDWFELITPKDTGMNLLTSRYAVYKAVRPMPYCTELFDWKR